MAVTGTEIFNMAMALIDEYTSSGVADPNTTTLFQVRAPSILNILQNELLINGDYYKIHEISRKPIIPLYGHNEYKEHISEDVTEECIGSITSYSFEVNGEGTIYIEDLTDNWNILETITIPSTVTTYTSYKGIVSSTSGATKSRIRFSGNYYYNYTNIALFNQPFSSDDNVPNYRPYIKYEMPADFYSIDQVIKEIYPSKYIKTSDYYWEGKNELYLSYDFDGNIRIIYKPIPTKITSLTQTLEIDDILATTALTYGLASQLLLTENATLSNFFSQKFDETKSNSKSKPSNIVEVEDVYGGI